MKKTTDVVCTLGALTIKNESCLRRNDVPHLVVCLYNGNELLNWNFLLSSSKLHTAKKS